MSCLSVVVLLMAGLLLLKTRGILTQPDASAVVGAMVQDRQLQGLLPQAQAPL